MSHATLSALLAQPDVQRSLELRGLSMIAGKMLEGVARDGGEAVVVDLVNQALYKHFRQPVEVPRVASFLDASPEELAAFPQLRAHFVAFLANLKPPMSERTIRAYGQALQENFSLDGKAPHEMACPSYREALIHTLEGNSNRNLISALKYFSDFWRAAPADVREGKAGEGDTDPAKAEQKIRWRQRVDGATGKASPELLLADELPGDWHMHNMDKSQPMVSSPGGRFYKRGSKQVAVRLRRKPTPLEELYREHQEAATTPPRPTSQVQAAEADTPEVKAEAGKRGAAPKPKAPPGPPRPLMELVGPAEGEDRQTDRDKDLLAQVLATFTRHLNEAKADATPRQQSARELSVTQIFKLFSRTGRNFDALIDPRFMELVQACEENKRVNHSWSASLKRFAAFWREVGGYDGKFDRASREDLYRDLIVKPYLVDAPGICGTMAHLGACCNRARQRCDTCDTILKCNRHDEHSIVDCREVFWAKHGVNGTRARTMADFLRPSGGRPQKPKGVTKIG